MKITLPGILVVAFFSCAPSNSDNTTSNAVAELTQKQCDSPDADISCSFDNMPSALTPVMQIAGSGEPGEKITITGTIFKTDGISPSPGVILYAYHTDNQGYYSKNGTEKGVLKWHGRLHGWCRTDKNGNYTIKTIRPAPYPNGKIPAHIHAAVRTDSGATDWINDFVFQDDPLVDQDYLSRLSPGTGTGVVALSKAGDHDWVGKRDIILDVK